MFKNNKEISPKLPIPSENGDLKALSKIPIDNLSGIDAYRLGWMYELGFGIRKDRKRSVRYFAAAVEKGNLDAATRLAYMYSNGIGVAVDKARAKSLYLLAGRQADSIACYNLGLMSSDDATSFFWFYKSAVLGDVDAQHKVGFALETGKGVPVNYCQAVFWYRLAAREGHLDAIYNLALCYDFGRGVRKSHRMAAQLYHRGAKLGDSEAAYNYAVCCERGLGIKMNKKEALRWYRVAMAHDIKDARKGYLNLKNQLS